MDLFFFIFLFIISNLVLDTYLGNLCKQNSIRWEPLLPPVELGHDGEAEYLRRERGPAQPSGPGGQATYFAPKDALGGTYTTYSNLALTYRLTYLLTD